MICEKSVYESTININTAWGSSYESSPIEFGNWPVAFTENPNVFANTVRGVNSGEVACAVEMITDYSTTYAGKSRVYRPTTASGSVRIHVLGIGTWK